MKCLILILSFIIGFLAISTNVSANSSQSSFLTLISLVRGQEKWVDKKPWLEKHIQLITQQQLSSTWLIDYDVITDPLLTSQLLELDKNQEIGVFLEITKQLAQELDLPYDTMAPAHRPSNVFVSGYTQAQRGIIIDTYVHRFIDTFGFVPNSVGAWFIDSWSLSYLKDRYGIDAILLVAEQYGTDQHTIRGHPWQIPYYPSTQHALIPGRSKTKLNSVVVQWAAREPFKGYGDNLTFSNYSVQANDYTRQGLDNKFFQSVAANYLANSNASAVKQLTIGIEVGQEGADFFSEFATQLDTATTMLSREAFVTLSQFSQIFQQRVPDNPPIQFVDWQDQDGSWAGWITTTRYRIGLIANHSGIRVRDLRRYDTNQDDLAFAADKRAVLFRQSMPIIDEIGLNNAWYLTNTPQQLTIDRNRSDQITIRGQDGSIVLTADHFYLTFPINSPIPHGLIAHPGPNFVTKILFQDPSLPTKQSLNWFLVYATTISLSAGLLAKYFFKYPLWWISTIINFIGITALTREIWLFSPIQDIGPSYLWLGSDKTIVIKLIIYIFSPLTVIITSLWLQAKMLIKTNSVLLSLTSQWCVLIPASLGWILPYYRNLPLTIDDITGIHNFSISFLPFISTGMERYLYIFSPAALNIQAFSKLYYIPIGIIIFIVANLGILAGGLLYLLFGWLKSKQWLTFFIFIVTITMSGFISNTLDIRSMTAVDFIVRVLAVWGTCLLVHKLTRQLHKRVLYLGVVLLFSLTIPGLKANSARVTNITYREDSNWFDRFHTIGYMHTQANISDAFVTKLHSNTDGIVVIPQGIEDYYYLETKDYKSLGSTSLENSYATIVTTMN